MTDYIDYCGPPMSKGTAAKSMLICILHVSGAVAMCRKIDGMVQLQGISAVVISDVTKGGKLPSLLRTEYAEM